MWPGRRWFSSWLLFEASEQLVPKDKTPCSGGQTLYACGGQATNTERRFDNSLLVNVFRDNTQIEMVVLPCERSSGLPSRIKTVYIGLGRSRFKEVC